jgi:hypothetical protein
MEADGEDVRFEQRHRGSYDAGQSTSRMGKERTIIGTVSLYIDFFTNHILCECLDSLSLCRQPIRAPQRHTLRESRDGSQIASI